MADVLIRHVYSAFAAYSGRSVMPLLLQPSSDTHNVWKFQSVLRANDLLQNCVRPHSSEMAFLPKNLSSF